MYRTQWSIFGFKYILQPLVETITILACGLMRVVSLNLILTINQLQSTYG